MEGLLRLLGINKDSGSEINQRLDDALDYIKDDYHDTVFSIFSFVDSDGISYFHPYIRRNLIEIIRIFLKDERFKKFSLVDGCNVVLHQPEYIDYMLNHNMKLSDIKKVNKASYRSKIESILDKADLPSEFSVIGDIYRLRDRIYKTDNQCGIRDAMKYSYEPLIIYGCGYNSLLRILNEKYSQCSKDKFSYDYDSVYNDKVIVQVMDKIKYNIEHFLSINSHANIIALGNKIHTDSSLFNELILQYNVELNKLCDEYSISMLDSNLVNYAYYEMYYLAALIIERLYFDIKDGNKVNKKTNMEFLEDNLGMKGVIHDINRDYEHALVLSQNMGGYDKNKEIDKAEDILNERRVFEKVLKRG